MYEIIDQDTDEIVAGALGEKHDDAQTAINFLEQISDLVAKFITIMKEFFEGLKKAFENV